MIIVIDGPAGAGKSTTAREIARQTGYDYVDSGAIYRGFTYLYKACGDNRSEFLTLLKNHNLHFDFHVTEARVFHGDKEITRNIRSHEVSDHVSEVAVLPEVRDVVRDILREVSGRKNAILEGRDLGTEVFPDADLKFFLTADQKARAKRRYDEHAREGTDITFDEVVQNVEKRDRIDTTRDIAPLKQADDAVVIDTTSLSFDEQVARIMSFIRKYIDNGTNSRITQ